MYGRFFHHTLMQTLFGVQLGYLFVLLLVLVAVLHLVPFVDQTNQLSLLLLLQVRDE